MNTERKNLEAMLKQLGEIPSAEEYFAEDVALENASKSKQKDLRRKLRDMRRIVEINQLILKILSEIDHSADGYIDMQDELIKFMKLQHLRDLWREYQNSVRHSDAGKKATGKSKPTKAKLPANFDQLYKELLNAGKSPKDAKSILRNKSHVTSQAFSQALNKKLKHKPA